MRTREIMINLRDGVRLQKLLYLPPVEGRFPAHLARSMYGADRVEDSAKSRVEKGYAGLQLPS